MEVRDCRNFELFIHACVCDPDRFPARKVQNFKGSIQNQ